MSIDVHDDILAEDDLQSFLDPQRDQFSNWLFDQGNGHSLSSSSGTGASLDLTQSSQTSGLDLTAPAPMAATGLDLLGFGLADAKGGGGTHGGGGSSGGGGGGGGGGGATTYVSVGATGNADLDYNIAVVFNGSWTSAEQKVVMDAADFVSQHIITGDVTNDTDLNGNAVDDLTINMSVGSIDRGGKGALGNVLAQTSVDAVRDPGSPTDQWLPVTSSTKLDSFDLSNSTKEGLQAAWDYIIVHEMLHAAGFFGYIFDQLGLTDGNNHFTGSNAVAAYGNGSSIPLSADGGSYSGSHWDENTFAPQGTDMPNELMTQYIADYSKTPTLSAVTVAALHDLGYTVSDPGANGLVVDTGDLIA